MPESYCRSRARSRRVAPSALGRAVLFGTRCVVLTSFDAVRMLFEVHNFFLKISYSEFLTPKSF